MKSLTRMQLLLMQIGGVLLILGAALPLSPWHSLSAYVFAAGALLFSPMQLLMRYEGRNLTLIRLRRQQITGALLLLVAAALLLMDTFRISPLAVGTWKLPLIVAAILELYTAFRIPHELKKES